MRLADLPSWFAIAFAVAFGLIWGSFLNVVIYRVPRGLSVVRPGSACPACGKPADAPGNAVCDNSCGTVYCSFGGRAPCATWHAEDGRAVAGHSHRCGSESDEPAPDLTRACPTCGAAGGAPCDVRGGLFGCPCSTLTCPNGHLHFTAATGRGSVECRGRAGDCELYADDEAAF